MSALLPSVTFLETRILHSSLASEPTQALAAGLVGTSGWSANSCPVGSLWEREGAVAFCGLT